MGSLYTGPASFCYIFNRYQKPESSCGLSNIKIWIRFLKNYAGQTEHIS